MYPYLYMSVACLVLLVSIVSFFFYFVNGVVFISLVLGFLFLACAALLVFYYFYAFFLFGGSLYSIYFIFLSVWFFIFCYHLEFSEKVLLFSDATVSSSLMNILTVSVGILVFVPITVYYTVWWFFYNKKIWLVFNFRVFFIDLFFVFISIYLLKLSSSCIFSSNFSHLLILILFFIFFSYLIFTFNFKSYFIANFKYRYVKEAFRCRRFLGVKVFGLFYNYFPIVLFLENYVRFRGFIFLRVFSKVSVFKVVNTSSDNFKFLDIINTFCFLSFFLFLFYFLMVNGCYYFVLGSFNFEDNFFMFMLFWLPFIVSFFLFFLGFDCDSSKDIGFLALSSFIFFLDFFLIFVFLWFVCLFYFFGFFYVWTLISFCLLIIYFIIYFFCFIRFDLKGNV